MLEFHRVPRGIVCAALVGLAIAVALPVVAQQSYLDDYRQRMQRQDQDQDRARSVTDISEVEPQAWIRIGYDLDGDGRIDAVDEIYAFDLQQAKARSDQRDKSPARDTWRQDHARQFQRDWDDQHRTQTYQQRQDTTGRQTQRDTAQARQYGQQQQERFMDRDDDRRWQYGQQQQQRFMDRDEDRTWQYGQQQRYMDRDEDRTWQQQRADRFGTAQARQWDQEQQDRFMDRDDDRTWQYGQQQRADRFGAAQARQWGQEQQDRFMDRDEDRTWQYGQQQRTDRFGTAHTRPYGQEQQRFTARFDRDDQARGQFEQDRRQRDQYPYDQRQMSRRDVGEAVWERDRARQTEAMQQRGPQRVVGTLSEKREQRLVGHDEPHLLAKLETDRGIERVNLGPINQLRDLDLNEGDSVFVVGAMAQINGRPILAAERIEAGGKTVRIQLPRTTEEMRRFTGEIQDTRNVTFQGTDEEHVVARVRLASGDTAFVNLGTKSQVERINLKRGDEIRILAQPGEINGQSALIAQEIWANNQTYGIERREQSQRFVEARRRGPGPFMETQGAPGLTEQQRFGQQQPGQQQFGQQQPGQQQPGQQQFGQQQPGQQRPGQQQGQQDQDDQN
jgi:hypothetical protein